MGLYGNEKVINMPLKSKVKFSLKFKSILDDWKTEK